MAIAVPSARWKKLGYTRTRRKLWGSEFGGHCHRLSVCSCTVDVFSPPSGKEYHSPVAPPLPAPARPRAAPAISEFLSELCPRHKPSSQNRGKDMATVNECMKQESESVSTVVMPQLMDGILVVAKDLLFSKFEKPPRRCCADRLVCRLKERRFLT